MQRITKIIAVIFVLAFVIFITPLSVNAHIGGGPPFLKVNGQFAQTNPYYQSSTTLTIPQDLTHDMYLINKPIIVRIDTDALTKQTILSPESAKKMTFRWSIAQGVNFEQSNKHYLYSDRVILSFPTTKSYLVILEGKLASDADYVVLDTVQIDVVPSLTYKRPQSALFVGTENLNPQKSVLIVSQDSVSSVGKTTTNLWDFNEG